MSTMGHSAPPPETGFSAAGKGFWLCRFSGSREAVTSSVFKPSALPPRAGSLFHVSITVMDSSTFCGAGAGELGGPQNNHACHGIDVANRIIYTRNGFIVVAARGDKIDWTHASIIFVFEIGDPAGASTVSLFLNKTSIINSNSLRGNIHTLRYHGS
jgi:hypothetical protein